MSIKGDATGLGKYNRFVTVSALRRLSRISIAVQRVTSVIIHGFTKADDARIPVRRRTFPPFTRAFSRFTRVVLPTPLQ